MIIDNHVNYVLFCFFLTFFQQGNTKCEEKMNMVFHLFDDDCTGKLSFENLKRVAEELEENLTDEELQVLSSGS